MTRDLRKEIDGAAFDMVKFFWLCVIGMVVLELIDRFIF